jgi:hypothetical protein
MLATRRRAERERDRDHRTGLWLRIEPGSTSSAKWYRAGIVFVAVLGVSVMFGWLCVILRDTVRWEHLRSRGRDATGVIFDSKTVDNGDDGSTYYVYASVAVCDCSVKLRVADDSLPIGATIPVRYDPSDHSNAVALVDRPSDDLTGAIAVFIAVSAVIAIVGLVFWQRHRRGRALFDSTVERRSVKFEAWRRQLGDNTKYYLVLYDASSADRSEPICCVPVCRRSIQRLQRDDVLQLYGAPERGTVVLRREGTVVFPTGSPKPGSWECSDRVG